MYKSRKQIFDELFPDAKAFRWKQATTALFDASYTSWNDVTSLPDEMRATLEREVPWMSVKPALVQESSKRDTFKAALEVDGGQHIESVLMMNARGYWTICVSSQVGCAMRCGFCATGKMGLVRSLDTDEIVDQYRFWVQFLREHPDLPSRISNVVFMGMGEPMANYENVRATLNTWLAYTDLGLTRLTVSTVGILPRLDQLLNDPEWPHVRLAVSLHSADPIVRKRIVPTSYDDFLPKLADWARRYLLTFGNRRHHLTFEYVMLSGVNDTDEQARQLAKFVASVGNVRVNLIPYNFTGIEFQCSNPASLDRFQAILEDHGVTVTRRRTMGDDIAAACGQLATETDAQTPQTQS
ncbi:MAG: 23S rRNA (adenine(2503)-C(2))-methyltransferase RlmN [Patescibacteria group bacterium]